MTREESDLARIQANSHQLADLGAAFMRCADAADAAAQCLGVGGFHGTRQGVQVAESVAEFQASIRLLTGAAIEELRRHGASTAEVARTIVETDGTVVAKVRGRSDTARLDAPRYFEGT